MGGADHRPGEGLRPRRDRGTRPRRGECRLRARPVHRHHGPVGLRQVDAHALRWPGSTRPPPVRSGRPTPSSPRLSDKALTRLRRDRIGFVFQSFNLLPTLTAEQNILLPLRAGRQPAGPGLVRPRSSRSLGLGGPAAPHGPSQLSGGQQQRVACARALLARPARGVRRRAHRQPRLARGRRGAELPAAQRRETGPDTGDGHPRSGRGRPTPTGCVLLADGRVAGEHRRPDAPRHGATSTAQARLGALTMLRITLAGIRAARWRACWPPRSRSCSASASSPAPSSSAPPPKRPCSTSSPARPEAWIVSVNRRHRPGTPGPRGPGARSPTTVDTLRALPGSRYRRRPDVRQPLPLLDRRRPVRQPISARPGVALSSGTDPLLRGYDLTVRPGARDAGPRRPWTPRPRSRLRVRRRRPDRRPGHRRRTTPTNCVWSASSGSPHARSSTPTVRWWSAPGRV